MADKSPIFIKRKMTNRKIVNKLKKYVEKYIAYCGEGMHSIIDVGANCGVFSMQCAMRRKGCKVVAFEPLQFVFHDLRKNILLNHYEHIVTPVKRGLWDSKCEMKLGFPVHRENNGNTGLYSVHGSLDKIACKFIKLDDWCEEHNVKPSFIKIDAEGSELHVLRGAEKALKYVKHIVYEENADYVQHLEGIRELLADHGFKEIGHMTKRFDRFWSKKNA